MLNQADLILRQAGIELVREGIAVPAGQRLPVAIGDIVRVHAIVEYRGPILSDTFYGAIGNRVVFFDEIWVGTTPVSFPQSYDYLSYELTVDIPVTAIGLFPWTPGLFDLYVKLVNNLGAGLPELSNVIEVLLRPEFRDFTIASYEKV